MLCPWLAPQCYVPYILGILRMQKRARQGPWHVHTPTPLCSAKESVKIQNARP